MIRREQGWAFEGPHEDVWKTEIGASDRLLCVLKIFFFAFSYSVITDDIRYKNTITGDQQETPPPQFRGGILADQMGLGKSLSMLALIASSPAKQLNSTTPNGLTSAETPSTP